jgi:hypothetical protein
MKPSTNTEVGLPSSVTLEGPSLNPLKIISVGSFKTVFFDSTVLPEIEWSEATLASSWNRYFSEVSGSILKGCEKELNRLRSRQKLIRRAVRVYIDAAAANSDTTIQPAKASFEELVAMIESAQNDELSRDLPAVLYHVLRTYAADTAIVVAIRRSINAIKRALEEQPRAVFCGIDWHKRTWFLLHGSHPPKNEAQTVSCSSLGCALF